MEGATLEVPSRSTGPDPGMIKTPALASRPAGRVSVPTSRNPALGPARTAGRSRAVDVGHSIPHPDLPRQPGSFLVGSHCPVLSIRPNHAPTTDVSAQNTAKPS